MEDLSQSGLRARIAEDGAAARPYPPSYMDRLMEASQRLPVPYWLPYLVLFVLLTALNHLLAWADGWLPAFMLDPFLLLWPLWICLPPAIMTHLNSVAKEALASFSPLLQLEPEKLAGLKYGFTTMPQRGVVLSGIAWSVLFMVPAGISAGAWTRANGAGVAFALFLLLEAAVSFFAGGGALVYHSLRQLTLVNRTVKMVGHFNLFRLDPVYAFSRLTARTGVAWMILLTLNLLTVPFEFTGPGTVALYVLDAGLAVAAFILPLQFVHQRLRAEKRRLLAELERRFETTLGRFHNSLDEAEMPEMDRFDHALAALNAERDALNKIPTLPWRGATLSAFLSAILLPLVLFVLQTIIARWLPR